MRRNEKHTFSPLHVGIYEGEVHAHEGVESVHESYAGLPTKSVNEIIVLFFWENNNYKLVF